MDIASQLEAIQREVERMPATDRAGERVSVLLRRTYDTPIQDVWEALTQVERIERWFMPISGDLRPGGTFQLEGNASGDILACEPPSLLRVTFGDATSIVELRLIAESDSDTVLEFEHTVPIEMAQSGAGALYVGPGWDGALLGLGRYLSGEAVGNPVEAANSPEGLDSPSGPWMPGSPSWRTPAPPRPRSSPRRSRCPGRSSRPTSPRSSGRGSPGAARAGRPSSVSAIAISVARSAAAESSNVSTRPRCPWAPAGGVASRDRRPHA